MAKAGFNNDQSYVPDIKDSAVHAKKVPVPEVTDKQNIDATVTPGQSSGSKFAPKSNAYPADYKAGSHVGDKK